MSETLVRIPISGQAGFHPLALAPGLPMLDAKKLTYQVLLGWFGDVLADPQLDEDGVTFHVQKDGKRIPFVDRQLATAKDLEGPLSAEFERLKKALFDVRPVSPSERLIFNRLQPPIGNHSGYLYRVTTEDGADRLIWCWGFQRRSSEGTARICPNIDCSLLLVEDPESLQDCPRCDSSLAVQSVNRRRTRFPLGAFAAALVLTSLAGGTYWYAANAADGAPADFDELGLSGLSNQLRQAVNDSGKTNVAKNNDAQQGVEPNPEPLPIILPQQLENANQTPAALAAESPKPRAIRLPDPKTGNLDSNSIGSTPPQTPDEAGPFSNSPRQNVGRLTWHQDYLAAYKEALEERRQLLMVFRDFDQNDSVESFINGFANPLLESKLEEYVRVILPVSATTPGSDNPQPLLAHRSFRHLGVRARLVVVDLRKPGSKLYGRLVSAVRQPANGKYSTEMFSALLNLPDGDVQQRSLLLAIRMSSPQANFSTSKQSANLNVLSNRNSRYMAHFGQAGIFDVENRASQINQEFGESADVTELVWASDENLTLHEAAVQAVASWTNDANDQFEMTQSSTAYGLDMLQDPNSGRWFATCLIVRTN
jgi:hypothetical protein